MFIIMNKNCLIKFIIDTTSFVVLNDKIEEMLEILKTFATRFIKCQFHNVFS